MQSTIHYETLDKLSEEAKNSPILNSLMREIENTENTFDLVRLLTSYVIGLDKQAAIRREEVAAYLKNKSQIDPLYLSKERFKKEFMGAFIPDADKL